MGVGGGGGVMRLAAYIIVTAVAAAASVPSSFTSTKVLWNTFEILSASSRERLVMLGPQRVRHNHLVFTDASSGELTDDPGDGDV
jgi:hypothetical protein